MPPSRYLALGWPEWGETDCLLDRAVAEHDRRLCPCGCGYWSEETRGDEHDGEFKAVEEVCHARAATDRYQQDQKKPTPGALVYAVRKVDGED